MMRTELLDRLASVGGLSNDAHVRLTADKPSDALTHNGVVVDDEDPNRAGLGTHAFSSGSFPENLPANFSAHPDRRRSTAARYASVAGMLSSTSVPEFNSLHTVSLPPRSLALSRMPRNPKWS